MSDAIYFSTKAHKQSNGPNLRSQARISHQTGVANFDATPPANPARINVTLAS